MSRKSAKRFSGTCSTFLIWRVSRSNDSVRAGNALGAEAPFEVKRKPAFGSRPRPVSFFRGGAPPSRHGAECGAIERVSFVAEPR
ncbi:hypothetical protein B1812_06240 [Methylocystis bryophila]|uniref:Uncharacterized protein n=1 Tax=Methylocystis bryophila TaxID=655015 RepID=A0A1W6MT40_9HYPH|nr:hypothetical protein B1812_06240 [Methylocystis bryophila]